MITPDLIFAIWSATLTFTHPQTASNTRGDHGRKSIYIPIFSIMTSLVPLPTTMG